MAPTAIVRARPRSFANFSEIGRSGLSVFNGEVREEFLPELKGKSGRKIIREMSDNDPIIGAIFFAMTMMMRQAKPHIKPAKEDSANSAQAEFVQSCLDDMSETWPDVVSEIMTMLPYGWAWLETVYKKRSGPSRDPATNSRFTDGKIGWRKMPLRAQDSLKRWELDTTGGIQGMWQQLPQNEGGGEKFIPIEKSLLFRTVHNKNNPEGRSMLRNIYRPWMFKKRIEEIEGIGIERDLAGLPVMTSPEDLDLWNENDPEAVAAKTEAEIIVRSIRRDEQEGVLLPFGWTLELLSSAGKRNFDTTDVIGRYNNVMAMVMLADFIILGHNNRYGSFALSSNKTHMFAVALGGWLDAIAAIFNRYAIPRLLEVNGESVEDPPQLEFEDIEMPDLGELGTYIANLSKAGFQVFPNEPIEKRLLQAASLPIENVELGREPEPPPMLGGPGDAFGGADGGQPGGKPRGSANGDSAPPGAKKKPAPRADSGGGALRARRAKGRYR